MCIRDSSTRADDVRNRRISRKDDNMLKITTDGRKAARDLRLVDPMASFTDQSVSYTHLDVYKRQTKSKEVQQYAQQKERSGYVESLSLIHI